MAKRTKVELKPGIDFRKAKAATIEARRDWAAAELAWHNCARPGSPDGVRWPNCRCDNDCAQIVKDAEERVGYANALVIACGEVIKDRSFEEVIASHGERPSLDEALVEIVLKEGT